MLTSLGGLLITLGLFLLVALIFNLFHKLWWIPTQIQKLMAVQGIRGPSYKLIHGNTKEISKMVDETMSRPLSLDRHDIVSTVYPHIHTWTNIYGKNYLQWQGFQAQFIVTDPELCREILIDKDRVYLKKDQPRYMKKLFGDGQATTNRADKWMRVRKVSNHAFHGEGLNSMVPTMVATTQTMLENWKKHDGKEIEVCKEFRFLTSEVISRVAFGSSYLEGQNIFEMLMKYYPLLFKYSFTVRIPIISKFYKTRDETEADKLEKEIRHSIMEIVRKREEMALTSGGGDNFGHDFLGMLLKAQHHVDEKQRISVDDLVDECKTFYIGGQLTTGNFLSWTIFLLALHTDWQEEARKEVLQSFGKQSPYPDGLAKMKTMGMILNESLRLYPPVVNLPRKVVKEVRLGKFILPPNLELLASPLPCQHDPKIWGQDSHLFRPDRFSDGVVKATNNNPAAYIPFGNGWRICVGDKFALVEAKVVLSMILQKFSFTLSPAYVHSPYDNLTVRPQHGVQVMLHSLED